MLAKNSIVIIYSDKPTGFLNVFFSTSNTVIIIASYIANLCLMHFLFISSKYNTIFLGANEVQTNDRDYGTIMCKMGYIITQFLHRKVAFLIKLIVKVFGTCCPTDMCIKW